MLRLDKSKIYVIAIITTLLLTGIGYAFLSSELSLNGSVSVKKHEIEPDPTPDPEEDYVCKRATTLHEEPCDRTDAMGCKAVAEDSTTITYGSLGTEGTLTPGDAFDCDVNKDGEYNSETERFYYVSDLDTDNNYGVLAYYNNVSGGEPNNTAKYAYDSSNNPRVNGPITLLPQLPTTEQWKNVSLKSTTRKIKDEQGTEYIDFSYEGYAARLLTIQEANSACGVTLNNVIGELDTCRYLMENTKYRISSGGRVEYWVETLSSTISNNTWVLGGEKRRMWQSRANNVDPGVRPVIEVPKSKIKY